jgi:urea transport system permease protein
MLYSALRRLLAGIALSVLASAAQATIAPALLQPLAGDDPEARVAAVASIGALGTPEAAALLRALQEGALYAAPDGQVIVASPPATPPGGAEAIVVNNRLRAVIAAALSGMDLLAPQPERRLAAARAWLGEALDAAQVALARRALAAERDAKVRSALQLLVAVADLQAPDAAVRRAAATELGERGSSAQRPLLQAMLDKGADGRPAEPDAFVRSAAEVALNDIDGRQARTDLVGNLFYGISLGSVLLLAALGLAITFGLMGIINMAHGELLMIGAYATYLMQSLFRRYLPEAADLYLLAALPAAFVVAALVGMALERTVIRWLYGRPLETLLATWGISLVLMQAVRTLFGAQNVEVANPAWMSGGVTVLGSLVLPYNRIAIILFAVLVTAGVWLLLNGTRLGLFVRAVMQNRRMAGCVGVPTGRIDMLTFGLGSGIAGLGGVALSQLGNVGPDLGQSYIIDSFMVVVLGGVGQLAGTVIAALGLGEVNKLLEPLAGAVLAKIGILVFIVIFIQRRPQGLFAVKGRSVE